MPVGSRGPRREVVFAARGSSDPDPTPNHRRVLRSTPWSLVHVALKRLFWGGGCGGLWKDELVASKGGWVVVEGRPRASVGSWTSL